jgi:hypothetical protein
MKNTFFLFVSLTFSTIGYSQTDTIFSNNDKISCTVKEIISEEIKYVYPNEELTNSIYKNVVQKIVFKSGPIQTFAQATSFKIIKNVDDYKNVTITQIESEIKGLFKLGEINSKAKGTTTISNQIRVKERAYNKLKLNAAMMGANIIYIYNQRAEGNKQGGYYQSDSSNETSLSGIAYSNSLPNYDSFINIVGEKKYFTAVEKNSLWSSGSDINKSQIDYKFRIDTVTNESGFIMVKCNFFESGSETYRVVSFNREYFNLYFEDKSSCYNVKVKF